MAAIRRGVAASDGFRRFARKTLKALARDLDRAPSGGHAAIHEARKRLKLLRSLMRMLRPAIGKQAFDETDRDLRRAHHLLADARRAGAMQDALDKLERFAAERGLEADLGALRRSMGPADGAGKEADLAPAVGEAKELVTALASGIERWRMPKRDIRPYVKGMLDCYGEARKHLRKGFAGSDIERLHEGRKSLIQFRYQLDMLAPLWPTVFKAWAQDLQALRELLGDLGDLADLQARLDSSAGIEAARKAVEELIAAQRSHLISAAEPQAARLFAEEPAALADRLEALWKADIRQAARMPKALSPRA